MYKYIFKNFFTNKEFLINSNKLPGTLFTPLHIIFYLFFISLTIYFAYKLSKRKDKVKKVFIILYIILICLEFGIILWDTFSKSVNSFSLKEGLSLYPCSVFLYVFPFIIWGSSKYKKMAYGYLGTIGLLGSIINLLYPYRLVDYSCISFCAIHSLIFHSSMLFVLLVLLFTKTEIYKAKTIKDLIYPTIPILFFSVPANLINYSKIDSDYMYFKGYHPLAKHFFPNVNHCQFTLLVYLFYIFFPVILYLPSYLKENKYKIKKINYLFKNKLKQLLNNI